MSNCSGHRRGHRHSAGDPAQRGAPGSPDLSDLRSRSCRWTRRAAPTATISSTCSFTWWSRNAAWANADMPARCSRARVAIPPLPLNLYYLITAFGRDDDVVQPFGHELLGKAMSVLYDHPVLSAADITSATQTLLPVNDLASAVRAGPHHPAPADHRRAVQAVDGLCHAVPASRPPMRWGWR